MSVPVIMRVIVIAARSMLMAMIVLVRVFSSSFSL
jgi:hypothetical protein